MNMHEIDKPFGELDDATKGALLLAAHRGETIEATVDAGCGWNFICRPAFDDPSMFYRVRPPVPVVVPKTFHGVMFDYQSINTIRVSDDCYGHDATRATFTFPTIDGKHIAGVYTSPAGHQIVIEVSE